MLVRCPDLHTCPPTQQQIAQKNRLLRKSIIQRDRLFKKQTILISVPSHRKRYLYDMDNKISPLPALLAGKEVFYGQPCLGTSDASRQELQQIKREGESIPHLYTHHVLLLAAIPVICAFIGTTQVGWRFGNGQAIKLDTLTALYSAVIFYTLILAAVALMGQVIYRLARRYASRPSWQRCTLFAVMLQRQCSLAGLSPFTL